MTIEFGVTWDYRCPFARNVNEHILTALEAGVDWKVTFIPFSLGQVHVEDGGVSVWDDPASDSGILALQTGVFVRDHRPDQFLAVHRALFDARHSGGSRLTRDEVAEVLSAHGVDFEPVLAAIDSGEILSQVREEHVKVARTHSVWGVPTFIAGSEAAFVRLMTRSPRGSDVAAAKEAIERIVAMLEGWPSLNEFKHTTVGR